MVVTSLASAYFRKMKEMTKFYGARRSAVSAICASFGFLLLTAIVALGINVNNASAGELVMFEQSACEWCEVWEEEVGGVYHKTPEGQAFPVRRVDIHETRPRDLLHVKGVVYTPTFVLMQEGEEVGRILGYSSNDFFWGQLGQLIEKARGMKSFTKQARR